MRLGDDRVRIPLAAVLRVPRKPRETFPAFFAPRVSTPTPAVYLSLWFWLDRRGRRSERVWGLDRKKKPDGNRFHEIEELPCPARRRLAPELSASTANARTTKINKRNSKVLSTSGPKQSLLSPDHALVAMRIARERGSQSPCYTNSTRKAHRRFSVAIVNNNSQFKISTMVVGVEKTDAPVS